MEKNGYFSWDLDLYLIFFHGLWPHLCFKQDVLGFYKQATHGSPSDELFLLWGPPFMTGDQFLLEMLQKGPDGPNGVPNGRKQFG